MKILDGHVHIGASKETKCYTPEEMWRNLEEAGVDGACIFAFPEDMYRTVDSKESRVRANRYVLEVSKTSMDLYPFYFVWNDYIVPEDLEEYSGIKWHRHADEPTYNYDEPKCFEILKLISELELPVILEEEFENTLVFVRRNPKLKVIIPHMGMANGGAERMSVFFSNPNVYFDTAIAPIDSIRHVLSNVGPERVIFGSDVSGTRTPFYNFPKVELGKLHQLNLDDDSVKKILGGNIKRLIKG
jgi:hypothetical protein